MLRKRIGFNSGCQVRVYRTVYLLIHCPSEKNRKSIDPLLYADKSIVVFVKGPEDWWIKKVMFYTNKHNILHLQ